jgi:hypothetical protein
MGAVDQPRPVAPSRVVLLVALAAAPILVLLGRMPTDHVSSHCGMVRAWNGTLPAEALVWFGVWIAYKAIRATWKLRFAELA